MRLVLRNGFKAVAGDIANFATGGFIVLLGTKTD